MNDGSDPLDVVVEPELELDPLEEPEAPEAPEDPDEPDELAEPATSSAVTIFVPSGICAFAWPP